MSITVRDDDYAWWRNTNVSNRKVRSFSDESWCSLRHQSNERPENLLLFSSSLFLSLHYHKYSILFSSHYWFELNVIICFHSHIPSVISVALFVLRVFWWYILHNCKKTLPLHDSLVSWLFLFLLRNTYNHQGKIRLL